MNERNPQVKKGSKEKFKQRHPPTPPSLCFSLLLPEHHNSLLHFFYSSAPSTSAACEKETRRAEIGIRPPPTGRRRKRRNQQWRMEFEKTQQKNRLYEGGGNGARVLRKLAEELQCSPAAGNLQTRKFLLAGGRPLAGRRRSSPAR